MELLRSMKSWIESRHDDVSLLRPTLKALDIVYENPHRVSQKRASSTGNFPKMKNNKFLSVFENEQPISDSPPVWMMRQAGRYLPEFQSLMKGKNFFSVCHDPFLSAELTLQPIQHFHFDCAIVFSDILVIPQALGLDCELLEGKGPVIQSPLRDPSELSKLRGEPDEEVLAAVYDAIFLTRHALQGEATLIGFCGAPWTLMCFMVEGALSKTFHKAKTWLNKYPIESHKLLRIISSVLIEFLSSQIKSGAQAVQIFESYAGELSVDDFREFSLQYIAEISAGVKKLHPSVPIIFFPKGQSSGLRAVFELPNIDGISCDWTVDCKEIIQLGKKYNKVIQGNLDPGILPTKPSVVRDRVIDHLHRFQDARLVVNLGHGIWPNANLECVQALVDTVRSFKTSSRSDHMEINI